MNKSSWSKVFLQEASFFSLTYLLGIFLVLKVKQVPQIQKNLNIQPVSSSPWPFLAGFLAITFIFFLLLPLFKKHPVFLKGFFIVGIFVGLDIVIGVFLGEPYGFISALILAALLCRYPKIIIHNILFSCSLAGVGLVLALSLNQKTMIIILILLAFYDIIAVYLTKHMIKMVRVPAKQGIFFGVVFPQKIEDYFKNNPQVELGKKNSFSFLGGGDIILPLMLPLAVAQESFLRSVFVFLFALLGLIVLTLVFNLQKKKKPMPGLPLLSLFVLFGYLIASLIWK